MLEDPDIKSSGALYPGVPTDWVKPPAVAKQAIP